MKNIAYGTLLFCVYLPANAATLTPGVPDECWIRFSGPVDANTPAALEVAIKKVKAGPCWKITEEDRRGVYSKVTPELLLPLFRKISLYIVDSPGGDLVAATQVGRILRRELISTIIPKNSTCASACVFLYLGGVERSSLFGGRIGLHRPYSTRASQSFRESQEQMTQMISLVRSYLEEMSIPSKLLDVINAIPPDEIRWLPETDQDFDLMKELLLDGEDPSFTDLRDSEKARMLGLTKAEYYERHKRVKATCKPNLELDEYDLCFAKIMSGKK